ncbi:MAG: Flp family type IVb pilin [Actinomycetota bacterium]|nr:Flp family type IVb pilin [Actinomycetota bacterium]
MLSIYATLKTLGFSLEQRLRRDETGATAVEYALLVGLIAVVLIGGVTIFGNDISAFFGGLAGQLGILPKTA